MVATIYNNHTPHILWEAKSVPADHGYDEIVLWQKGPVAWPVDAVNVFGADFHIFFENVVSKEKLHECQTSETDNSFLMWNLDVARQ